MTSDNSPLEDDRLRGASSGEYFLITCGKCGAELLGLKYRKSTRGPVIDYHCPQCAAQGSLKLNGVVVAD